MTTVSKDFIVKNGIIVSNTITSTDITTTSAGGGSLYLNGSNNRIDFNNSGVSAPTFTTISTGTKIVLYPNVGAAAVDYALGIESGTMWSSVPTSANQFKWYAGTTSVASLSGAGTFSTTNISYTGTLTGSTGVLNIGSGQLYKDASGNVGIGTSSPSSKLDITWTANAGIRLSDGTVTGVIYNTGGNSMGIGAVTNHPMVLYTNNTERMRIDSSGNVGIGTSSPQAKLQVTDSAHSCQMFIGYTDNNCYYQSNGAQIWSTYNGTAERMRIDSSGNVGIGTATPAQKLSVAGVIESTTGGVKFPDGTTQTSALSDNIYTVTGITGTAATITVDFSLVYSNAIIITLPTGTTSATINFININSKATSGMLFAFSIILSHVTALTATTSVVWRFGAAATSGSLPKWTGNIVPPSTVAANAIDIWSFFSYDVGTSLVGSLSMADIRNA